MNGRIGRGLCRPTLLAAPLFQLLLLAACNEPADVLSGRNDDARTGANLQETVLNPGLLTKGGFGRLFTYDVDGFIYAQPLVASAVQISSGRRNVLVVATTTNKLYALDADSPGVIWQHDLNGPGVIPDPRLLQVDTLAPSVGILSTPVIDKTSDSLYVVSRTYETASGTPRHIQRIYNFQLSSGALKRSAEIGSGIAVNGISFNPEVQINRPGLALVNGMVVVLWGSFLDGVATERGWVMAFDKDTLSLNGVFCTTCFAPTTSRGLLWQSGRPPAVASGRYLYFFTANGWLPPSKFFFTTSGWLPAKDQPPCNAQKDPEEDPAKPAGYLAESLVRLDTQATGSWKDNQGLASWTPYDWCELDLWDADLGGSGPMLIPGATPGGLPIAIGGGKAGVLYAIDTSKINQPDLVEWHLTRFSERSSFVAAINECVDFESPYTSFDTRIDVPSNYGRPWAVNVAPSMGGEPNMPPEPAKIRPLCAPISPNPGWGVKLDGLNHHIMGGPVFLPASRSSGVATGETNTGTLFIEPENLPLLAIDVHAGRLTAGPFFNADLQRFPRANLSISGHPGGLLALSASDVPGSGIVWVSHYHDLGKGNDTIHEIHPGVLDAFDAEKLVLIWSSDRDSGDHVVGNFQKFTPPTVANGKVYLAAAPSPVSPKDCRDVHYEVGPHTFDRCLAYSIAGSDGHINVYGKLPTRWPWSRVREPQSVTVHP
jgi:outer membrane protein assembly factor BamB